MTDTTLENMRLAHEALMTQFREHTETIQILQHRLRNDILPGVLDELRVPDGLAFEEERRARDWINDSGAIFRTLKRHKYTTPFALEAMRDTLLWRLRTFRQEMPLSVRHCRIFHALPKSCQDSLSRPIVLCSAARLSELAASTEDLRSGIVHLMEALRLLLYNRDTKIQQILSEEDIDNTTLQYTLVLDVKDVSVRTMNFDLFRWYTSEVQPRFPGIVGTVIVVNYTWTQSGLWNVARRMLPKSTLLKIHFMNESELTRLLTVDCLPQEYGGTLAPLAALPDELQQYLSLNRGDYQLHPLPPQEPSTSHTLTTNSSGLVTRVPSLLPTSLLNPFFGYPVSSPAQTSSKGTPGLKHGRRRKRDLAHTLLTLWWRKWNVHMGWAGFMICLYIMLKFQVRIRSALRSLRS